MNTELIQQAAKCLAIQGVYLKDARLSMDKDFSPRFGTDALTVQFRASAKAMHDIQVEAEAGGEPMHLFQVDFDCGLRLINPKSTEVGDAGSGVVCELAAIFLAEYAVLPGSQPDKEALEAFAKVNAGYHVWPYWREYVQNMCARSGLPNIAVPMYTLPKAELGAVAASVKKRVARKKAES